MEWVQVFSLFLGNIALVIPLWLWTRTESRNEMRHMDSKIEANLMGIREEMKDFHGKLLVLEERYLKLREEK